MHLDQAAVHAGFDQPIDLGNLRADVERLPADAAAGRGPCDMQRGGVVGTVQNRAGRCREDGAAPSTQELPRGDVAYAWRSVAQTDRHVDTREGDIIEIEASAHTNSGGRRDEPTGSASVDPGKPIFVRHRRPRCHRALVFAFATTLVLVIRAGNTHDLHT
jgi:hypothetical protein